MRNLDLSLEKCWVFAQKSKAEIRFGAFIEKNGQVLGFGWNRRSTEDERRFYHVDYCTHAEEAALFMALARGANLNGPALYISGFLKNGKPFLRPRKYFTCRRCANRVLIPHGLPVKVRTKSGWQELSSAEALRSSLKFLKKGFWIKLAKRH